MIRLNQMIRKVHEDGLVEVYRIECDNYDRKEVAKALRKQPTDMFNIVDDEKIKYYSPQLPAHKKVIELYAKYGSPIVVVWKRVPEHIHI